MPSPLPLVRLFLWYNGLAIPIYEWYPKMTLCSLHPLFHIRLDREPLAIHVSLSSIATWYQLWIYLVATEQRASHHFAVTYPNSCLRGTTFLSRCAGAHIKPPAVLSWISIDSSLNKYLKSSTCLKSFCKFIPPWWCRMCHMVHRSLTINL